MCAIFISLGGYIMYIWAKGKKNKLLSVCKNESELNQVKRRDLLFPNFL